MQETAEGFEVFVAVLDAGSISAAARELGVPRETLSRQLARLEDRLGVRLAHRGARRLLPTAAGEALLARARPLVLAAKEAEAAVRRLDDTPRGLLRVSVPPNGGAAFIADIALPFLDRWPEVRLELIATTRHVDLVAEQVDVALRAGEVRDPSLVARRLWSSRLVGVASPTYARARGLPERPAELSDHDCVLGADAGVRTQVRWPLMAGGQVPVSGRIASNDLGVQLRATLAGHGIGLLPAPFAREAIEDGALLPVLPEHLGLRTSMSIVYVERALMPAKVRAFVDHIVLAFDRPPDEVLRGMTGDVYASLVS
jgi:DNA-binding transcriptional LysR family regulator